MIAHGDDMGQSEVKIAASILAADFHRLGEQIVEAEAAGADFINIDVMDGHYVPNISVGPVVVEAVDRVTDLPLDVHLMIEAPERYLGDFCRAGADIIIVHVETCPHLHRTLHQIKEMGRKAGVALNPSTPVVMLEEVAPYVDQVLVMTVNPGFGGQAFISEMPSKIARVRTMLDARGSQAEIAVDGGITTKTVPLVVNAGARVLVAGSAIFREPMGIAQAITQLRAAAQRQDMILANIQQGQPQSSRADPGTGSLPG
jgi:ribulose-phosphate 3-epimerase